MSLTNLTRAGKNGLEIEKKIMVDKNCVKIGSLHFKTIWNKSELEHLFKIFVRSSKQNNVVDLACAWVDNLKLYCLNTCFSWFYQEMSIKFNIGKNAQLNWFLGMKFESNDAEISINRRILLKNFIEKV